MEVKCLEEIADLLKENEIGKAFEILERHIQNSSELSSRRSEVVANYAYHKRTEKYFNLGSIDWAVYNVSNSQIIVRTLDLAQTICRYLEQQRWLEVQPKSRELNLEELEKQELEWELDKKRLKSKIEKRIQRITTLERRIKCLTFLQRIFNLRALNKWMEETRKERLRQKEKLELEDIWPELHEDYEAPIRNVPRNVASPQSMFSHKLTELIKEMNALEPKNPE